MGSIPGHLSYMGFVQQPCMLDLWGLIKFRETSGVTKTVGQENAAPIQERPLCSAGSVKESGISVTQALIFQRRFKNEPVYRILRVFF